MDGNNFGDYSGEFWEWQDDASAGVAMTRGPSYVASVPRCRSSRHADES